MSKKLFALISAIIAGVQAIAVACVTYFVQDTTLATAINGAVCVLLPAIVSALKFFVVDKIQNKKNK